MTSSRFTRPRGLTLLEVAIILTVIAASSMFAIPRIQSTRIVANEMNARAVLLEIQAAERTFLSQNNGETYGVLNELLGDGRRVRVVTAPRAMARASLKPQGAAFFEKGYHFTVYLPGAGLPGVNFDGLANLDLTRMNKDFIAYAWPIVYGYSGRNVYAINSTGELRQYRNDRDPPFAGLAEAPPANLAATSGDAFGGPPAAIRDVRFEPIGNR